MEKKVFTTKERIENMHEIAVKHLVPELIRLMEYCGHNETTFLNYKGDTERWDISTFQELMSGNRRLIGSGYTNKIEADDVFIQRLQALGNLIEKYKTHCKMIENAEQSFITSIPKILKHK